MDRVKALFNVVYHNLTRIHAPMDYDRITDSIIALANAVRNEPDVDWYLGDCCAFALDDLIVGAYWHFTEWHAGQYSKSYAALCAIGTVFDPGMTYPEPDNMAYQYLNEMAEG